MERNPYITLNDETEITYSDLKADENGEMYVTIYFETPSDSKSGFSSMDIDTNTDIIKHFQGYTVSQTIELIHHYQKIKDLCVSFAKEDRVEGENPVFLTVDGYQIYIRKNKKTPLEPIYVNVAENPTDHAAKIWILRDGTCRMTNADSQIPEKKLQRICRTIEILSEDIVDFWINVFETQPRFIG